MRKIKISSLWNSTVDLNNSVIVSLIKILSKRDVEIVSTTESDILIFGPFESQSIFNYLKRRFLNSLKKRIDKIDIIFPNIDFYMFGRKTKPIKIYLSWENYPFPKLKHDFSITSFLGINNENHLRFPLWKNLIDWSHLGVNRKLDPYAKRFDSYYKIDDLINPQGDAFMQKPRRACLISSHLTEPRKSLYLKFKEKLEIDGYGPVFDNKVKDHYSNPIKKKDILKNYAFNLCPENSLFPGYYTEKIPEAFLGKSLPITWAECNVYEDFNKKSFINLLEHTKDNFAEILELIKDDDFLKKFANEPLIIKKPNLDNEINFVKKILELI